MVNNIVVRTRFSISFVSCLVLSPRKLRAKVAAQNAVDGPAIVKAAAGDLGAIGWETAAAGAGGKLAEKLAEASEKRP